MVRGYLYQENAPNAAEQLTTRLLRLQRPTCLADTIHVGQYPPPDTVLEAQEEAAVLQESLGQLAMAFQQLPIGERLVMRWRYFDQKSVHEIATRTGNPAHTGYRHFA